MAVFNKRCKFPASAFAVCICLVLPVRRGVNKMEKKDLTFSAHACVYAPSDGLDSKIMH